MFTYSDKIQIIICKCRYSIVVWSWAWVRRSRVQFQPPSTIRVRRQTLQSLWESAFASGANTGQLVQEPDGSLDHQHPKRNTNYYLSSQGLATWAKPWELYDITLLLIRSLGFPSGIIRKNWNDTEKISMAPAQGWQAQIEKCKQLLIRLLIHMRGTWRRSGRSAPQY